MSLALVLILSKMNLFVSVLNASLIIVNAAQYEYDLMCPHKSHLMLRATTQKCDDQEFYHCLYDINTKKISEKCFRPDDYPQGYHGVLSGKLHAATCSDGYFAPKISWSYDGFTCPYQKSVCSEEGQIVVNNGSNKEDIKCRCDYRKGYAFIRNPQNKCTCSPWTEDCSCHRVHCNNNSFIFSEDYTCVPKDQFPFEQICKKIPLHREKLPKKDRIVKTDSFSSTDIEIGKVTFSIVVAVGIMLPIGTYVSLKLWYMYKRKLSKVGDIKFFLKTVHGLSNFQILRETLKQKSIVVLKGRYGTGKTTIAKCLQLPFCGDRCRIVYIKAKELDKIGQTPNYIITDSLGNEMSFDSATIPSFIDIRKTKLVFEVDHDTPDLTDFLKKIVNNPQEIIWDLGEKDFYTTEDKKNILTLQINKYEVSIEDDSNMCQPTTDSETMTIRQSIFTALLTENPFLGFPLMCAEICSHKDHLHLGLQYFRQPPNNLVSKLDKLRNEGTSDKCCAIQYCLLVSMLLSYGQETSLDDIIEKSFSKIMQTIYPDKWQSYQTEKAKDMASYLIPEYIITEDNSTFKFSHGAIYLAVMISFGRKHPLTVLRECKVRDIIYFIRPINYQPLHDEICLRTDYLDDTFVVRLTNSIMLESVYAEEITKQLIIFTNTYKETDLLLKIVKVIKNDKVYKFPSRLTFFTHVAVCAHAFSTSCVCELRAYILAWIYVVHKADEIEDKLSNLTKQILDYDSIENILLTVIDQHDNTLLHYFVIWDGNTERSIISNISNFEKGLIKEEDIARLWKSSNLQNKAKHTPLHFAAFFGRHDLFKNLVKIIKCKSGRSSFFTSKSEKSNLESLIQLGIGYVSKSVSEFQTNDKERKILFETWLIPLRPPINFGESDEYDEIVSFMHHYKT